MNPDKVLDRIIQANPKPAWAESPGNVMTRSALLVELDRRSGDMQTQDRPGQKTETRTSSPGPSRRRGLLVAATAVVVAIIAAGVVIGLVGGSSDEPDVGSLQPGPISSFEDIAGIYEDQGAGGPFFLHFFEDGTVHASSNPDLIVDRPVVAFETTFDGTEILITTTSSACDQPHQGGTYELHLLENGNLEFVAVDEDPCARNSSELLNREWAPVP